MSRDPLIGRIWRSAVLFSIVSAVVALVLRGWSLAAGVLGGALLIGVSFYTLENGVSAIVAAASSGGANRKGMAWTVARVVLRYALLAFLAYVMIARLRLHPIGLMVGASSIAAAALVEAVRLLSQKSS